MRTFESRKIDTLQTKMPAHATRSAERSRTPRTRKYPVILVDINSVAVELVELGRQVVCNQTRWRSLVPVLRLCQSATAVKSIGKGVVAKTHLPKFEQMNNFFYLRLFSTSSPKSPLCPDEFCARGCKCHATICLRDRSADIWSVASCRIRICNDGTLNNCAKIFSDISDTRSCDPGPSQRTQEINLKQKCRHKVSLWWCLLFMRLEAAVQTGDIKIGIAHF